MKIKYIFTTALILAVAVSVSTPLMAKDTRDIETDINDKCSNIEIVRTYKNASISPEDSFSYYLSFEIGRCQAYISSLPKEKRSKYNTLYFYSFVNKDGNSKKQCPKGTAPKYDECNKALSEDRNLWAMDKVYDIMKTIANDQGKQLEKIKYERTPNYNDINFAFSNVSEFNKITGKRYNCKYCNIATKGDIIFKSVPTNTYGDAQKIILSFVKRDK